MLTDRKTFFVKEHVALMKLTDTYDILDPETKTVIGTAKEEPPTWSKYLRILVNKAILPTRLNVYEKEGGPPVLSVQKLGFFRATLPVTGPQGESLGFFKTKAFSFGGGFWVHDAQGERYAEVKGDWKGWNFRFLTTEGEELGTVTKKWAGVGKELFTSADNYMISIGDMKEGQDTANALLLAAGLAIDVVFKEGK